MNDPGDHASDAIIIEQRGDGVGIDRRLRQALRGYVERVGDRHEFGQSGAQQVAVLIPQRGEWQAKLFGQIQRQRLERPGFAEHRRARRWEGRGAQCDFADVAQLFECFGKYHPGALDHRAHQLVIARHCAGMGRSAFTRGA